MTCYRSQSSWHSYVKNSLDPVEMQDMTSHLLLCSECLSIVSAIRETVGAFENDRVVLTPPLEIKLKVMTAIDKHKYKKSTNSSYLSELKNWGVSMLAAGLLLFALNLTSITPPLESSQVTNLNSVLGNQIALPFYKISQVTQAVLREIDSFTEYQLK